MKFSYVIFICPLVITSVMAMIQLTHTTFESCDPDEWVITNVTLKWINDTKIITGDITYKKPDNHTIYRIQIMIDGCKNRIACTGEPIIWVDDIDCDAQNLSESDLNVCKFANEFGNFEKEKEWFIRRYGLVGGEILFKFIFCINLVDDIISISQNGTE